MSKQRKALVLDLTNFATWLDADEHLLVGPNVGDQRTHEQLAEAYLAWREENTMANSKKSKAGKKGAMKRKGLGEAAAARIAGLKKGKKK